MDNDLAFKRTLVVHTQGSRVFNHAGSLVDTPMPAYTCPHVAALIKTNEIPTTVIGDRFSMGFTTVRDFRGFIQ